MNSSYRFYSRIMSYFSSFSLLKPLPEFESTVVVIAVFIAPDAEFVEWQVVFECKLSLLRGAWLPGLGLVTTAAF